MRVAFFQRIFARYQAGLVKEMAGRSSHSFRFFSDVRDPLLSGIEPLPAELWERISVVPCRTTHFGVHLAFQWRAVWEALFGRFDVFILEGSLTMPTNWMALLAAKGRRKRVFFYTHGWKTPDAIYKRLLRWGMYWPADGLLLYGWRSRRIGEREGFPPWKLHVVYNCLDDEEICRQSERVSEAQCQIFRQEWFGPDATEPVIASVGRLVTAKKFGLLVEAAEVLMRKGLHVNLLFIGDGPDREILAAQAEAAGVRLAITGARHDETFLSLAFTSADLSVIPGSAGLSVIHSLSYGTPVVVHSNEAAQGPETEAVAAGVNGAIFREGDVVDLTRAIRQVLIGLPRGPLTAARCRGVVGARYNPVRMREAFDRAVSGDPAEESQ